MASIDKRENGKWQAKIRRKGWPAVSKTFQTAKDAEAWSRATEREMDIGAYVQRDDAERTTFEQAGDRYRREVLPSKRGRQQDGYVLARVVEEFGKYSLAGISSAMLSNYRDKRLKVVSGQTVVHELGMISRIYKACSLDWGIGLPLGNPVKLVRKPKPANERTRRLEIRGGVDEEALILAALDDCKSPWPKAAVMLALETAARQSELLSMTWQDVDLKKQVARLRGIDGGVTKSGDTYRDVPLTKKAVLILQSLPRALKGKVLPISQNALQLAWERACRRARRKHVYGLLRHSLQENGFDELAQNKEIRALVYRKREPLEQTVHLLKAIEQSDNVLVDLHFHDLRHEGTSRLAQKLEMHELMKITGHKTSRMLMRYYHPDMPALAAKLG